MTLKELYASLKTEAPGLHRLLRAVVERDYKSIIRLTTCLATNDKPGRSLLRGYKTPRALLDDLENDNDHNLVWLLTAIIAKDYAAVLRMGAIISTHNKLGHMPYGLTQERVELCRPFYKAACEAGVL